MALGYGKRDCVLDDCQNIINQYDQSKYFSPTLYICLSLCYADMPTVLTRRPDKSPRHTNRSLPRLNTEPTAQRGSIISDSAVTSGM